MRLSLVLAALVASASFVPVADAWLPVCKDKDVQVGGVTAVYVNFDCWDDVYVCEVGQTDRDCDRLFSVALS